LRRVVRNDELNEDRRGMSTWSQALRRAVVSGSVASVCSTLALTICGYLEIGRPAAPVNAISHWLWDREAKREDRPSVRHTAIGYVIHHASSVFWATFYEKWFEPRRNEPQTAAATLRNGATVAALACLVDYQFTPQRLKPGFETHLSAVSLFAVYAAFALGLSVSSCVRGKARSS
jgi:hypothetical protein